MGTAIAIVLRSLYHDIEVIGHDKDLGHSQRAEKLKAIDHSSWNLPSACENAQLVILAIPAESIEATIRAIAPDLMPGAIVTDTCAAKSSIVEAVKKYMPAKATYISSDIIFSPARLSGDASIESITPELFKGAAWTLTPIVASPDAVDSFTSLVTATGAMPIFMDAIEHDGLRLAVNIVPAALSSALMLAVSEDEAWRERIWMAGTTFGAATANVEFTNPTDIAGALVAQPEASTHWLNQLMLQLTDMRDAIEQRRADKLETILKSAADAREHWTAEWYKGREQSQAPIDVKRPSLLGMVVGDRLATQMERGYPTKTDKDKDKKSRR